MRAFEENIFVIGAGSMAEAFIRGITEQEAVRPEQIFVVNRSKPERVAGLQALYGVTPAPSWSMIRSARLVVIAVKPADVASAIEQARPYLDGQLLLSFAAGVTMGWLRQLVEGKCTVIRTMPNIPVAVLAGATAVSYEASMKQRDREAVQFLLQQVGDVIEVDESMMDAATAFSGSGPGFVCYFLEAMENAAVQLGFEPELARRMLLQTVIGTAKVLGDWGLSPQELRKRVTSPGGTTHAGVGVMQAGGLVDIVANSLRAAADRSAEMGRSYVRVEQ